ncbi:hypothetical protein DERP_000605 [Dermatophagoides pteronyssinus]|uniref:Uncharacterized protein n=1 Tax=Dermatophagoides pteronyssinus TaxID=6956 RepID=A0ABQ8J0K9_DERPT|nr:hypothetical protein DERP_000605 [Dermatophagoides pteronyssinus]
MKLCNLLEVQVFQPKFSMGNNSEPIMLVKYCRYFCSILPIQSFNNDNVVINKFVKFAKKNNIHFSLNNYRNDWFMIIFG